jgi:hypothetical protein
MMAKPIDFEQARQAQTSVQALVETYPELCTPEAQERLTVWMERCMAERSGKQIFVRLPDELVTELDAYVEILKDEQPGLNPSRSDAIRILLYRGLEAEKARRQQGGEGE